MHQNSYLLLIILAILSMLGGIADQLLNHHETVTWLIILIWTLLFLIGAGAQRSTWNWTIENVAELFCGTFLIYTTARVIETPALIPAAVIVFAAATYLAALKMKAGQS
jgi:hypothetical protein